MLGMLKIKPRGSQFMPIEGLFAAGRRTAAFYSVWSFLDAGRDISVPAELTAGIVQIRKDSMKFNRDTVC